MAFFDEFGRKISNIGQTAVQKTRDVTDIARYNSAINDEEKIINSLYNEIGRIYVQLHAKDAEAPLTDLVSKAIESEQRISAYQKQIKDMRGIVTCAFCGTQLPPHSTFCSSCGKQVLNLDVVVCEACGASIDKKAKFCNRCGAANNAAKSVNSDMISCAGCGAMVKSTLKFCTKCGYSLKAENVQSDNTTPDVQNDSASSSRVCKSCGSTVNAGQRFCTVCGDDLDRELSLNNYEISSVKTSEEIFADSENKGSIVNNFVEKAVQSAESENDSAVDQADNMITCPKCEQALSEGVKFCIKCGYDLAQSEEDNAKDIAEDIAAETTDEGLDISKDVVGESTNSDEPIIESFESEQTDNSVSDILNSENSETEVTEISDKDNGDDMILNEEKQESSTNKPALSKDEEPKTENNVKKSGVFLAKSKKKLSISKNIDNIEIAPINDADGFAAEFKEDIAADTVSENVMTISETAAEPTAVSQENVQTDTVKCEKCGAEMASSMKFCTVCGSKLNNDSGRDSKKKLGLEKLPTSEENPMPVVPENVMTIPETAAEPTAVPQENVQTDTVKCEKCGAEMASGMKFCTVCGEKIGNEQGQKKEKKEKKSFFGFGKSNKNKEKAKESKDIAENDGKNVNVNASAFAIPTPILTPIGKKQTDIVKCKNCGYQIPEGMKFCTSCGTPIEEENKADGSAFGGLTNEVSFIPQQNQGGGLPNYSQNAADPNFSTVSVNDTLDKRRCTACGAFVDPDVKFCTSCGSKMTNGDMSANTVFAGNGGTNGSSSTVKCEFCGNVQDSTLPFCVSCGKYIGNLSNSKDNSFSQINDAKTMMATPDVFNMGSPEFVTNSASQLSGQTPQSRVCKNCGAALGDDMKFCIECGTKIS